MLENTSKWQTCRKSHLCSINSFLGFYYLVRYLHMTPALLSTRMDYIQENNEVFKNFSIFFFVKCGLRSCLHCIIQTLLWSYLFRLLCGAHDYISWTAMPLLLQLPIKYDYNIILHWVDKAPRLRSTDLGSLLSGMTQTRARCLLHPAQITAPKDSSLHTSPSAAFPFGELLPPSIKGRS